MGLVAARHLPPHAALGPAPGGGGNGNDPHFASVVLLCGFDGADGATSAVDESAAPHALTFAGNAQLDTAAKKFGTAALLLDGSGDHAELADSVDWHLPGEFTLEAWVRPDYAANGTGAIAGQWTNINPNCNLHLDFTYSGATAKRFSCTFSGNGNPTGAAAITPALENIDQTVFHHVAMDRDATNVLRLYLDGVMKGSVTVAGGVNVAAVLRIGNRSDGFAAFKGWIDELRLTKGVGRYVTDAGFTPPTAAFPRA